MGLRIFNTLSGAVEPFRPAEQGPVRIYVCGVTPYADAHIGHARPAVVFDVVRRWLERRGYRVHLVQNFTDIDDKIIARAAEVSEDPARLAERYIGRYLEAMDALGVRRADAYPRVTGHVSEIIQMVAGLEKKGYAYRSNGDVYFDVSRFEPYGRLSRRSVAELRAGARVEVDEKKDDPADFALWKAARPGEPAWESPWGPGRPGWHIECSAMSLKYCGSPLDIHGGGADLIFPHHENEIAQSEGYTGTSPFVRWWMHVGLVNLHAEKMSKSLGNVVEVAALLRSYRPEAIRLYLLNAHYRRPIDFDTAHLRAAEQAVERLENAVARLEHLREAVARGLAQPARESADNDSLVAGARRALERMSSALDDDFNTAEALGVVFEWTRGLNTALAGGSPPPTAALEAALEVYGEVRDVLGVLPPEAETSLEPEMRALVEAREAARRRRDWTTADRIRDQLAERGIVLEDTPQGVRWKRRERVRP